MFQLWLVVRQEESRVMGYMELMKDEYGFVVAVLGGDGYIFH